MSSKAAFKSLKTRSQLSLNAGPHPPDLKAKILSWTTLAPLSALREWTPTWGMPCLTWIWLTNSQTNSRKSSNTSLCNRTGRPRVPLTSTQTKFLPRWWSVSNLSKLSSLQLSGLRYKKCFLKICTMKDLPLSLGGTKAQSLQTKTSSWSELSASLALSPLKRSQTLSEVNYSSKVYPWLKEASSSTSS